MNRVLLLALLTLVFGGGLTGARAQEELSRDFSFDPIPHFKQIYTDRVEIRAVCRPSFLPDYAIAIDLASNVSLLEEQGRSDGIKTQHFQGPF